MDWYLKPAGECEKEFKSNLKKGLSETSAIENLNIYGQNEITEKKRTSLPIRLLRQLNDSMIIILIGASAISLGLSYVSGEKDYIDSIIIIAIVVLNAILGVVQESKAEKAIEALKNMSAPRTKVIRDGSVKIVDAITIVPGDIIILETGDNVPADGRLITSVNLKAEESSLTGESVPVEKSAISPVKKGANIGDRSNMVFAGTSITYGRGNAIVVATGMDTEVGKIATLILQDDTPQTPLQVKLSNTGKLLGLGALIICGIIFVMGILGGANIFDMFMTSVGLAVAAIPEGLPAVVTIMLAIGVQKMAKKNAIVRRLPAVETLGCANVICSDKTGTLTQNKMKVMEIVNAKGYLSKKDKDYETILTLGTLNNDSKLTDGIVTGDATEAAIVICAFEAGYDKNMLDRELKRVHEIPFDSERKLMTTIHSIKGQKFKIITKGAPDILIEKCTHYVENGEIFPLSSLKKKEILLQNDTMANKALRVIGTAYKDREAYPKNSAADIIEKDLVFAGLIGMIDPPRKEAKEAVATCKKAGIKPVMVTGDHVITAKAIAKTLGILNRTDLAMTGSQLEEISHEELSKTIYNYSVFARVTPEHKMRIVKAFQSRGAIVAMTGDGVNDAPALKAADIGCAMGISGTDVAKGAADMILTDDNFATIVEAVRFGRGIYNNIRKAAHFLLSSNIGEIITIFVGITLGWPSPLLAIQLLWVNLVTDSLPAIALGLDPVDKNVMTKKPYSTQKSLFSGGLAKTIALEGVMIGMLSLLAFAIGQTYYDTITGRTMAFAVLSISQLVHAFNMRSDESLFSIDVFENKYLVGAFFAGLLLQVGVIMFAPLASVFKVTVLSFGNWAVVAVLSLMPLVLVELEKKMNIRSEKYLHKNHVMDSAVK